MTSASTAEIEATTARPEDQLERAAIDRQHPSAGGLLPVEWGGLARGFLGSRPNRLDQAAQPWISRLGLARISELRPGTACFHQRLCLRVVLPGGTWRGSLDHGPAVPDPVEEPGDPFWSPVTCGTSVCWPESLVFWRAMGIASSFWSFRHSYGRFSLLATLSSPCGW